MAETVLVCHDTFTSSDTAPSGETWIDYWKKHKQKDLPTTCPCCNEGVSESNPMVGAHVLKVSEILDPKRPHYITPTCKSCNDTYKCTKAKTKEFLVASGDLCEI